MAVLMILDFQKPKFFMPELLLKELWLKHGTVNQEKRTGSCNDDQTVMVKMSSSYRMKIKIFKILRNYYVLLKKSKCMD